MRGITAITAGDPCGIGPEITVKALKALLPAERKRTLLIGEPVSLEKCGWRQSLVPLLPVSLPGFRPAKPGHSAAAGEISFRAFSLAVRLALRGKVSAVVTGPVSKKSWLLAGLRWKGHTEYLRETLGAEPLMSFHKGPLHAALITEHVSIKNLPGQIRARKIAGKAAIFYSALRRLGARGEMLVSGLNPHCGEAGELGLEEEKEIRPAIRNLRREGLRVSGPYNPDSVWEISREKKAAGILFMYHDQLLSGMKNLGGTAPVVHATWGLPFIRTSPAHGTAFDIAGKNTADPSSMLAAIKMALQLVKSNE